MTREPEWQRLGGVARRVGPLPPEHEPALAEWLRAELRDMGREQARIRRISLLQLQADYAAAKVLLDAEAARCVSALRALACDGNQAHPCEHS